MPSICDILRDAKVIAVLGMSPRPERTSHSIAGYMMQAGYRVIPVNPGHAEIDGLRCYPALGALDEAVDIVDVFRAAEHEREVAHDILSMRHKPRAVWFQLNAGGFNVARDLEAAGITVFVDQCIKVDHANCRSAL